MKLSIHLAVFVSVFVTICYSNPNLKKGELMEDIVIKLTQEDYEAAMNLFAEIGKLAKDNNIDLSEKEQKMFFDCYHYRRLQLRKEMLIFDKENNFYLLKLGEVKKKSLFYSFVFEIIDALLLKGDLYLPEPEPGNETHYHHFRDKVNADSDYFVAWYWKDRRDDLHLRGSYEGYDTSFAGLRTFLGDADPTVLDACLGLSTAKLEIFTIWNEKQTDPTACDIAQNCLTRGLKASSENNPDLIQLTAFIGTYCKPDAPNIIENRKTVHRLLKHMY